LCRRNPVRLLQEAPTASLERAAADRALVRRGYALAERVDAEARRPAHIDGIDPAHPVAFLCAEFGVHASLPVYAGGLGVLAGDLLKAASESDVPLIGIGLLYGHGYFRQQIDISGWQNEYWLESDPDRLPGARVTRDGVEPLEIRVPIRGRDVVAQVWRFAIGRTPLFLLDTNLAENDPIDRWITSRLYVADRETRLAQYALLGCGGVRLVRALGIEPSVFHLNEGHPALAPLELAAESVAAGASFDDALAEARARTIFTTHTPVPAGNETYSPGEVMHAFAGLDARLGTDWDTLLGLARVDPANRDEPPGMTCLALRTSRARNGVSRRHGGVARRIWRPVFGAEKEDDVPIGHVTNGVHLGTWMADPIRELLTRQLGDGWELRTADPETWEGLADLPDADLWRVRCELRARLVGFVREQATLDRLARGEESSYVGQAQEAFDPDLLTLGFARRLATYKRLHLFSRDLSRSLRLLHGSQPIQIVLAGKAHPADDEAKRVVQSLFELRRAPRVGARIAYLHDYDMRMAATLVSGCDVWVNVPRPPLEASGTSGMKAGMNGCLNLSVLDGWWDEGYDGSHGWAIAGDEDADAEGQDTRDAAALLDLLENEVIPLFHDRDADGIPRGWLTKVKASLRETARRFSAQRMLADYVQRAYHEVG
ncbi:MAG: alpha-glucan family phosphorylase, partial [Myxococcales bacterium]|nr:alpha-glucan family phosphorylase [Myxococcales bacterium]